MIDGVYRIWWLIDVISGEDERNPSSLGFCSFAKHLAFFNPSPVQTLFLETFIVDNDGCEEYEGCLNTKCPFNRTTAKSFTKRTGYFLDETLFEFLTYQIENVNDALSRVIPDFFNLHTNLAYEKPIVTFLVLPDEGETA